MEKIKLNLFKLIYISVFIFTIFTIILGFNQRNFKNVILGVTSIILYFILYIKRIKNIFPTIIRCFFILFVFGTIILGEVCNFYEIVPIWDDILHVVQGFFVSWIGFLLSLKLFNNYKDNNSYNYYKGDMDCNTNKNSFKFIKIFIIFFSFSLSLSIGTVWEIIEYKVDCNINVDMQKDNYVYKFNSIILNPKKDNEIMSINNIGYTSIYDKNGKKIVTFNGYLDIGNKDTMDDLIDTIIGSGIFIILYIWINNKNNILLVKDSKK